MGDEPLPEYLVAYDSAANRLSCWIPSEEGQVSKYCSVSMVCLRHCYQKFAVCWRDHGSKVDSCGFITLDGHVVPGRFLFGEGFTQRSGFRTSRTTERPFQFQKVPDIGESGELITFYWSPEAQSKLEIRSIKQRTKKQG